jgi:glycosyltransferase involved in cell wall biosynthesis
MKVLFLVELFRPYIGGVEVHASRFLPAMRERGHEFEIVTSHGHLDLPDEDDWDGIRVHRLPFGRALRERDVAATVDALRRLSEARRAFAPDLVHVQLTDATVFFSLRTERSHPCPILLSVRVSPRGLPSGPRTLLGAALARAAWVTANSAAVHGDLLELDPDVATRSSVVYNGLDSPPAQPLPEGPPVVVSLGRVVRDKGFDVLVDAFAIVRAARPDARLVIAGDGAEHVEIEAQARRLGLDGAVELPGWVDPDDVPALLARASVVVVPSRWREAFGLVALQAALAARPVVGTRVGGLVEIVEDGSTGILVPNEDAGGMSAAILALLDDPERARAIGDHARERALERFSWPSHLDAYDELYGRLGA